MPDTPQPRWYAVSFGNGNNGVSHLFPDYYVHTDDPWTLASAAQLGTFKAHWVDHVKEEMEVDGEADYTISAVIYDPPDDPYCDDGSLWSDTNGAWSICEVFPVTDDDLPDRSDPWHKPMYDSLEDCFDAELLAKAKN